MNSHDDEAPDGATKKRAPWRGVLIFIAKATVTVSLIVWLVRSGSLEVERLSILVDSAKVLLVTCVAWLSMQVGLATLRWRLLLRAVAAEVSLGRASALQVTALFFNAIVPGNIGGDFIKNQSVLGNQGAKLVVMVLLERAVGLVSLVWVGGVGVLLSLERIVAQSQLVPVATAVVVLVAGSLFGPWLLLFLLRNAPESRRELPIQEGGLLGFLRRSFGSALDAFQLIRRAKGAVIRALTVSFFMHTGNILYFLFLAQELGNPGAQFSEIAMVFPLGMLTLILPISISGFGVGHVMFNELFDALGLTGGATIFNVYIVAQIAPCLLGAITYLFMKGPRSPENKLV